MMKKQLFAAALIAALGFASCTGNGKSADGDTSKSMLDSMASKDDTTKKDSNSTPAKGASSSAAIGGFDTSRAKLDTANTNPKK